MQAQVDDSLGKVSPLWRDIGELRAGGDHAKVFVQPPADAGTHSTMEVRIPPRVRQAEARREHPEQLGHGGHGRACPVLPAEACKHEVFVTQRAPEGLDV